MARLLTSVSTPSVSESCSDRSSGLSSEAPLGEGLTEGRGGSLERDISFQTRRSLRRLRPELRPAASLCFGQATTATRPPRTDFVCYDMRTTASTSGGQACGAGRAPEPRTNDTPRATLLP